MKRTESNTDAEADEKKELRGLARIGAELVIERIGRHFPELLGTRRDEWVLRVGNLDGVEVKEVKRKALPPAVTRGARGKYKKKDVAAPYGINPKTHKPWKMSPKARAAIARGQQKRVQAAAARKRGTPVGVEPAAEQEAAAAVNE